VIPFLRRVGYTDGMAEIPESRWYRLAPDRIVIGLLVVECLLWLSERFQWFPFNEKKGWTVLIAVAAVCVAFLVMLFCFLVCLVFRWRFQFSIRSLLVLVVVVALPCSWLAVEMQEAGRREKVVAEIRKCRVFIAYDYQFHAYHEYLPHARPPEPLWLRNLLGDGFFSHVAYLGFNPQQVTDDWLANLEGFPQLQGLYLAYNRVTDAGLERLAGLTTLRLLFLENTKVTDAGVKKFQKILPNCQIFR